MGSYKAIQTFSPQGQSTVTSDSDRLTDLTLYLPLQQLCSDHVV